MQVDIEYTLLGMVQNAIINNGYSVKEINYNQKVNILVLIPAEKQEIFNKQIIEWTNGRCKISEKGEEFVIN